jgi:hypothetical protein
VLEHGVESVVLDPCAHWTDGKGRMHTRENRNFDRISGGRVVEIPCLRGGTASTRTRACFPRRSPLGVLKNEPLARAVGENARARSAMAAAILKAARSASSSTFML